MHDITPLSNKNLQEMTSIIQSPQSTNQTLLLTLNSLQKTLPAEHFCELPRQDQNMVFIIFWPKIHLLVG